MTLPKAIICNLDGCLADHRHRLHFVQRMSVRYERVGDGGLVRTDDNGPDWKPDYSSYFAAMGDDGVNEAVNDIIWSCLRGGMYSSDLQYIFITGRPEKYRQVTAEWLRDKAGFYWPEYERETGVKLFQDRLFMRPDFLPFDYCKAEGQCKYFQKDERCGECRKMDHRPAPIVKREIFEKEIEGKYDVIFVLEDSAECAEMYKSLGLQVLMVM